MAYRSKFTGAEVDSLLEQVQKGEVGEKVSHNIGSIDLFEQIIAQKQNHNLTLEDKEAILSGKVITTSAGNVVVPTISINSMGRDGVVLIFHFNERLYEMFVMWTDTLCYINGVFSFTKETKLYADTELSETSENAVQNKVVTEKLTELSEENARLKERIEENEVLIEDIQNTKIDRENDDYYPKMAVGLADNLAGVDVVDSYINFRRSGGGAITDGVARIEAIKGNSVVWNQLAKSQGTQITNGITFTTNADGSITVSGTATGNAYFVISDKNIYLANHKIAMYGAFPNVSVMFGNNIVASYVGMDYIFSKSDSFENNAFLYVKVGTTFDSAVTIRPRITDLTQMFGSGNEPTTIEEFYQRIPMGVDMNAYNEGEVIHMDVQSIESVGVNQWDEEWEPGCIASASGLPITLAGAIRSKNFSPIFPSTSYYVNWAAYTGDKYIFFYDREQNFISKSSFASNGAVNTPSNAAYFKIRIDQGSSFHKDICINRYDTAINGQYFPYIKRQEDLSIIRKYFPQGMKSAGSAHDAIRYNKASGKWEKVVRIGEVDLGSLTWSAFTTMNGLSRTQAPLATFIGGSEGAMSGILCAKFPTVKSTASMTGSEALGIFGFTNNRVFVLFKEGDYSDAASFKAAVSGVTLYYELAEPIITELDEVDQFKDLDYQVWNAGTEKADAEGKSAPLAADITYGFNVIGKIKEIESLVAALRAKVGI